MKIIVALPSKLCVLFDRTTSETWIDGTDFFLEEHILLIQEIHRQNTDVK